MGPQGAGATTELAFNLLVAAQVASLAECMALAAKGGMELKTMGEVVLELEGAEKKLEEGIAYLKERGVKVDLIDGDTASS